MIKIALKFEDSRLPGNKLLQKQLIVTQVKFPYEFSVLEHYSILIYYPKSSYVFLYLLCSYLPVSFACKNRFSLKVSIRELLSSYCLKFKSRCAASINHGRVRATCLPFCSED